MPATLVGLLRSHPPARFRPRRSAQTRPFVPALLHFTGRVCAFEPGQAWCDPLCAFLQLTNHSNQLQLRRWRRRRAAERVGRLVVHKAACRRKMATCEGPDGSQRSAIAGPTRMLAASSHRAAPLRRLFLPLCRCPSRRWRPCLRWPASHAGTSRSRQTQARVHACMCCSALHVLRRRLTR